MFCSGGFGGLLRTQCFYCSGLVTGGPLSAQAINDASSSIGGMVSVLCDATRGYGEFQ